MGIRAHYLAGSAKFAAAPMIPHPGPGAAGLGVYPPSPCGMSFGKLNPNMTKSSYYPSAWLRSSVPLCGNIHGMTLLPQTGTNGTTRALKDSY